MGGILVALVGFTKTFFMPLLSGTFSAPLLIYMHGAFLFSWVVFFATQTIWVHRKDVRLHRTLGWVGAGLVIAVVVSTLGVGRLASERTAATGDIDMASRELLVIFMEMTVFSVLVASAFFLRRRADVHRRLMLLAFIASLGPAWFRFRHYFPPIDNPVFFYSLLLADSLIVIAAAVDFVRERRVHWVYAFVGSGMVGVHLVEVFAFDTTWFRLAANAIARPFL
ncbi:hypothetical protein ATE48_07985 [Candidatus Viadribacter manganicus]|uniref:Uncharacterized protein n=2 Tax=Candidatus Viadribacter manganicus TaxID=1759059 RepID=A0A1B1AH39_9PROT|nr:hypothetical protein ATE48_07985 [Candidatus Viadribacter manganicus]